MTKKVHINPHVTVTLGHGVFARLIFAVHSTWLLVFEKVL